MSFDPHGVSTKNGSVWFLGRRHAEHAKSLLPPKILFAVEQIVAADRLIFVGGPGRANREAALDAAWAALLVVVRDHDNHDGIA